MKCALIPGINELGINYPSLKETSRDVRSSQCIQVLGTDVEIIREFVHIRKIHMKPQYAHGKAIT